MRGYKLSGRSSIVWLHLRLVLYIRLCGGERLTPHHQLRLCEGVRLWWWLRQHLRGLCEGVRLWWWLRQHLRGLCEGGGLVGIPRAAS